MLIGHYAPALVLARTRPSVKLWHLFLAVQWVDVLWGLFILTGVEHARIVPGFTPSNDLDLWDMPYSHSGAATVGWALFAFIAWRAVSKEPTRTGDAVVVAAAVASHFFADLLVHVRDLPLLTTRGTKWGFGLWLDRGVALSVEAGLFAAGALFWWWPRRTFPEAAKSGIWLLVMTGFAAATFFIPTPPSPPAMALTGLATYAACAAFASWAVTASSDTPRAPRALRR
jgi:hypothetical protein